MLWNESIAGNSIVEACEGLLSLSSSDNTCGVNIFDNCESDKLGKFTVGIWDVNSANSVIEGAPDEYDIVAGSFTFSLGINKIKVWINELINVKNKNSLA